MHVSSYGYMDDDELVLAALVGDLYAFDELVLRYRPAMDIVAEQIVGAAVGAEDVVQDALLLAYKALYRSIQPNANAVERTRCTVGPFFHPAGR